MRELKLRVKQIRENSMQPLNIEAVNLFNSNERTYVQQGNRGLLFDRFFGGYDANFNVGTEADIKELNKITGICGNKAQLEEAAQRRYELVSNLAGEIGIFDTDWHFVTGMGNSHPSENGFNWHPTLGTPYIHGASVKGLLRAWLEEWCSFEKEEDRIELIHQWFGRDAKAVGDNDSGKAGELIFFDAFPVEQPKVALDIMTPHMGKWYEQGSEKITSESTPADWHSPVPVSFLVTEKAKFLFGIAPRIESAKSYVKEAMEHLKQALAYLGAGSKTAAGYGHMSFNEQESRTLFLTGDEKIAEMEKIKTKKIAEESQKSAERLAEAGIAVGTKTWPKALVKTVNPGAGELTLEYGEQMATGKFYSQLSKGSQNKAKKKKTVYVEAEVEQQGNRMTILAIRELPNT